MNKLKKVEYKRENGKAIAIESYSDGTIKEVEIRNGMVSYILNGK